MAFQVPYARTDIYKYSFFEDTIRDLNALPAYIISFAESSEDPVARFTSLVKSRDVGPGEWMSMDVSPVKVSDSDSGQVWAGRKFSAHACSECAAPCKKWTFQMRKICEILNEGPVGLCSRTIIWYYSIAKVL